MVKSSIARATFNPTLCKEYIIVFFSYAEQKTPEYTEMVYSGTSRKMKKTNNLCIF